MKTTYIIFCTSVCILFFSCQKKSSPVDDTLVGIHYVDASNNNLFTNGYIKDSVRNYTIVNGQNQLNSSTNISSPFNCRFSTTSGKEYLYMDLGLNVLYNSGALLNNYSHMLIHLKIGVEDTIKSHFAGDYAIGFVVDSVWYNGILKWAIPVNRQGNYATNTDRVFDIQK